MNALLRRGQCPTLAAPMATGDGLLARLNPVASGLSPKALIGLSKAALRHGNGVIEVTARGSLQIRGLSAKSAGLLGADVDALGIAVRSGVPVETGPLAGLDLDETADPRPLAEEIRQGIAAPGLEGRLGPKVSVVVDGGGHSGLDSVAADVRLTAQRGSSGVAWCLAIAGDAVTARQLGAFAENDAVNAVLSLLTEIAARGRESRARDLDLELLVAAAGFEVRRSTLEREDRRPGSADAIPLTDTRFAVAIALPFGHVRAEILIDFLREADALGAGEIRLAPRRALLLLCPSEASARAVQEAADRAGLITDPADPRARIAACPGSPACASGHIAARALASKIAAASGLDLHVSGCEKRCAKPGHDGLTLLGTADSAALVMECAGPTPLAHVAKERAAAAIGRVAALVAAERKAGESDTTCFDRIGKRRLAKAFVKEH
jgi:precorrin-3B synthase